MSFSYIASPYSSPNGVVMTERFKQVESFVAQLLIADHFVYSPIVHCHELARGHELRTDFDYWQRYNRAMLSKASLLIVLMLDGWEDSKGVQAEIAFAEQCGIPVDYRECQ